MAASTREIISTSRQLTRLRIAIEEYLRYGVALHRTAALGPVHTLLAINKLVIGGNGENDALVTVIGHDLYCDLSVAFLSVSMNNPQRDTLEVLSAKMGCAIDASERYLDSHFAE